MPLKDEKIQDNRIRPTPEIGCPGHVPCAAASMRVRRMPMQPAQIGEWWRYRHGCDAGRARGPSMSACSPSTVNEGRGTGEIDHCGTPLIPPDARGTTDVGVVQAQLVQEAVRAPDTGGPPVPRSCSGTYLLPAWAEN
jgi:hypothetical protein